MSSETFRVVSADTTLIKVHVYLRRPISVDYGDTTVNPALFQLAYTMDLPLRSEDSDQTVLERIFYVFNQEHPADYKDRSLSVGDAVTLDETRSYLCQAVGWQRLPTVLRRDPTCCHA